MLQYLLNSTAIWLLSLVVFDLFLRRESHHNYNRFYLLFTLLLGAMLPLWQWQENSTAYPVSLQRPLERVVSTKQNIIVATTPSNDIDIAQWLGIIYFAGVFIALCLLFGDIIKLAVFYGKGKKTKEDALIIVATGMEHAPFSFLNIIFVQNKLQYSDDEWNMIVVHERQHYKQVHFADVLLLYVARIVFWFHPLIYVYCNRLLLVHEYQADNASNQSPQLYGRFLLEQTLFPSAPALSHSFNRSPIKNRIVMLTHRSPATSKRKMLLVLPLAVLCITCFSKNSFAQNFKHNGNAATCDGNQIEMSPKYHDTVTVTDPVTGTESTQVVITETKPLKINGKKIQNIEIKDDDIEPAVINNSNEQYFAYLMKNLRPLLEKLDDGKYSITPTNAVVNEQGKLAYYELTGIYQVVDSYPPLANIRNIDKDLEKSINKKTEYLLEHCPKFTILKVNGTNMPYRLSKLTVTVKYHQLNAL